MTLMMETRALECIPRLVPGNWVEVERRFDGCAYQNRQQGLMAIWSVAPVDDSWWQHLSVSHRARVPTWDELVRVKEWVMGTESKAVQILPARSRYVNLHPNVLHLFRALDRDPLPDFEARLPDGRLTL